MNQGMNTILSAIVGGLVGAGVVFFTGGNTTNLKSLELEDLRVANLTITTQAALLNEAGAPEVVIREGSILVEKVILGNKLIGRQVQGHAMVANRLFTTPDDLIATPMEQWRFFAEVGSSLEDGGEIVVRSVSGPASVNKQTTGGVLLRAGFDTESRPQILALQNFDRSPMPINWELSEQQKRRMLNTASANSVGGTMAPGQVDFNSDSAAPIYQGGAVATPDPNTMR